MKNRMAWGLVVLLAVGVGGVSGLLAFQPVSSNPALNNAAFRGDVGAVRALLAHGAKVNTPHAGSSKILDTALNTGVYGSYADLQHAEIVRLLIAHGANPDAINPDTGESPLLIAVTLNKPATAQALLKAGADPNFRDKRDGMTPLMWAVRSHYGRPTTGWTALVQSLHAHRAKVNAADKGGMTVLMHAASGGNPAVVKLLMVHGAQVNAKSYAKGRAYTALDIAQIHKNTAVVQLLKAARG
jgi:ankyrin repeat protein